MKAPDFIFGIGHRSGTNYLAHLLNLHPQFTSLDVIGQDYLFAPIDLLDDYAESIARHWNLGWSQGGQTRVLKKCLGKGLEQFLIENAEDSDEEFFSETEAVLKRLFAGWKCPGTNTTSRQRSMRPSSVLRRSSPTRAPRFTGSRSNAAAPSTPWEGHRCSPSTRNQGLPG